MDVLLNNISMIYTLFVYVFLWPPYPCACSDTVTVALTVPGA